ncbi:class II glutamine amidotransferase [Rhizobiales bacterium RZME27]|uniref:Class II glutamine amidotransferase n=1 Tax=Endobacterium cereale TaxID=2663029 RepID=A0A6A8A283_9HYPH|nr:class II glutamine amidotransferase [Endobacterium cereale]MEB2844537.1 class II glutamine amidotransferase [Endobacterium cereale]MQY45145.1 class II glutamine amidotransferase [Endobacterium cereale]
MCRFLAWIGDPRFIDEFVLNAGQSLVTQSRSALIGKTSLNADGFGLAWYGDRDLPCVYKDVHPAWSDENLKQIASHIKARLFLAHVRASTSTAISRNNCHPFSKGRWSFMHNGQLGGHLKLRQKLDVMIPVECYDQRYGATDSEAIFLIAVGLGLDRSPISAMEQAVGKVEMLAREAGHTPHMRFSACWSDGEKVYAARYASDRFVPSLFYRLQEDGIVVCSEPLDEDESGWIEISPGTAITTDGRTLEKVEFRPQACVVNT